MKAEPASTSMVETGCGGLTGDTEILPQSGSQSNHQSTTVQVTRGVSDLISQEEFVVLAHHLHNGNDRFNFVMGFTESDGTRYHRASKTVPIEEAIDSAWESIIQVQEHPYTVAVRSKNPDEQSCWAALDVDAHSPGETAQKHVQWVLQKLYQGAQKLATGGRLDGLATIVESSGRGFHFWLISRESRRVSDWLKLLRSLLSESGLNAKRDVIELFPANERGTKRGKALRLPGSANVNTWNPAAGTYDCSLILDEKGLKELIRDLPKPSVYESGNKRGSLLVTQELGGRRGKQAEPKPLHELNDAKRILQAYAIDAPASRHNMMLSLVGYGFYHFSHQQLRELAMMQYDQASPVPESSMEIHLAEFKEAYEGMLSECSERLSDAEREVLKGLKSINHKHAFVIVQNFARHARAKRKWGPDGRFPLSGLDLASRLGVSKNLAYRIRGHLIKRRCIRQVEDSVQSVKAAKFIWLLPLHDTKVPESQ